MKNAITLSFILLATIGCVPALIVAGHISRTIDVAYTPQRAETTRFGSLNSLNIQIDHFVDKRPQMDRVGEIRNGMGMVTATIGTPRPVPDIVRDALSTLMKKNNQNVVEANPDISVAGEITTFWLDFRGKLASTETFATIVVNLKITDGKTGSVIMNGTYQGYYNEETFISLTDDIYERVLNEALSRLMREIGNDQKIIDALQSRSFR